VSRRSSARDDGRRAELAVADYLFARGFGILGRNIRLGPLELDIVARSDSLVAIVEVRMRGKGSYLRAFESVDRAKRARLVRAAEQLWRTRLSSMTGVARVRIDVAAVSFGERTTQVEYVEGAIG
jgi:putative endonuclease